MAETVTARPAGHRHGRLMVRLLMVMLLLLLMKVQTLMVLLTIAAGVVRKVVRMDRMAHKLLVLRCASEYLHVRHNVLLLHGQGWRLLAEMIHMARFDQADVLTRKVVDHLRPVTVGRAAMAVEAGTAADGLVQRAGVERVVGASLQFRIVHIIVLRGMPLPSNTVLAGFDRQGRRLITTAGLTAASSAAKYLVIRFDATVLYRFGKTSLLHPTAGAGKFRGGGGRGHQLPTFATGLRHEGVNLLMLLLLLLLVMLVLLVNVVNLGIVSNKSSRFEGSVAARLLMVSANPKRVHRFKARLVGISIIHVDGGRVGKDGTAAALQQHTGAIRFVPHAGTVVGADLTRQQGGLVLGERSEFFLLAGVIQGRVQRTSAGTQQTRVIFGRA